MAYFQCSRPLLAALLPHQLHHPLVDGPLDGVDDEGTHAADPQASEEDGKALGTVGVLGNLPRSHPSRRRSR